MGVDELGGKSWEIIGWLSIDGATCGFGDAEVLGENFQLTGQKPSPSSDQVEDYTPGGLPLICLNTMADLDVPVEVARDSKGDVFVARLCLTDDVDDIEGQWLPAGQLKINTGKCLALDPSCSPSPSYRLAFDVVPGAYSAEIFKSMDSSGAEDVIAIRIRHDGGEGLILH